jgi:hypothetical protein
MKLRKIYILDSLSTGASVSAIGEPLKDYLEHMASRRTSGKATKLAEIVPVSVSVGYLNTF